MYATLDIIKGSKHSGKLIGVHQKLDKAARQLLAEEFGRDARIFPSIEKILYFEGTRGPDGLKAKSPGEDEPDHFIQPNHDDGKLWGYISDHQYNLTQALIKNNHERAAFEAAWMAHAITDGLTPAHHYPFREVVDELMTDKDYKTIFGHEIKGIMRGDKARGNDLFLRLVKTFGEVHSWRCLKKNSNLYAATFGRFLRHRYCLRLCIFAPALF